MSRDDSTATVGPVSTVGISKQGPLPFGEWKALHNNVITGPEGSDNYRQDLADWLYFLCERQRETAYFQSLYLEDREEPAANSNKWIKCNGLRPAEALLLYDEKDMQDGEKNKLFRKKMIARLTLPEAEMARACIAYWEHAYRLSDPLRHHWRVRKENLYRFALRRYCWPLVRAFDKADNAHEGAAPWPKRLFERIVTRYLRIWVVVLLGVYAVRSTQFIACADSPASCVALGTSLVALWTLCVLEVDKQNPALFENFRHKALRTWGLFWRTVLIALVIGGAMSFATAVLPTLEWSQSLEQFGAGWLGFFQAAWHDGPACLLRTATRGLLGAALGLLTFWLLQNKALTEPV